MRQRVHAAKAQEKYAWGNEKKASQDQDQVDLWRLKIYMYIYVAGKLVAYMIKWFYIRGRLDVIFIYMPIKVFVRPLSSPDQYHHRPITSPQKESPEDLEAQYLEISNGSDTAISRSCFSWDLMLKLHRQFCMAYRLLKPIYYKQPKSRVQVLHVCCMCIY